MPKLTTIREFVLFDPEWYPANLFDGTWVLRVEIPRVIKGGPGEPDQAGVVHAHVRNIDEPVEAPGDDAPLYKPLGNAAALANWHRYEAFQEKHRADPLDLYIKESDDAEAG